MNNKACLTVNNPLAAQPHLAGLRWIWAGTLMYGKQFVSYRADFWIRSVLTVIVQVVIAYYLWSAMLTASGRAEIGGMDLLALVYYYTCAGFVFQAAQPAIGSIAMEIYQGTLTRYLLYPIPFFGFEFLSRVANFALVLLQLLVTLGLLTLLVGIPPAVHLSPLSILSGIAAMFLSMILYYLIVACVECISFWMDSVWSLVVMFRFMIDFLGGRLLPITLFPGWLLAGNKWLPFPYLISFPVRSLTGQIGLSEWLTSALVALAWIAITAAALGLLWRRGLRTYTGVGQ